QAGGDLVRAGVQCPVGQGAFGGDDGEPVVVLGNGLAELGRDREGVPQTGCVVGRILRGEVVDSRGYRASSRRRAASVRPLTSAAAARLRSVAGTRTSIWAA